MKLPYRTAAITGATGFVGIHLCQALAKAGIKVHALSLDGTVPTVLKGMTKHKLDITDLAAVKRVIKKISPDIIFHLAAYGTPLYERDPQLMIDVNVKGTQHLLTAAAESKVTAFISTGSIKEYAPSRTVITEGTALHPWDEYAASKAAAAFFCQVAATRSPLAVTVLRFSPIYGPGEADGRFVPAAMAAALHGTPLTVSVGPFVRNFMYIDDAVQAFLHAAAHMKGYQEFIIGAKAAASFDDVVVAVEKATKKPIKKITVRPVATRDDSWVVSSTKAKRVLRWTPAFTLSKGIAATVKWYTDTHGK